MDGEKIAPDTTSFYSISPPASSTAIEIGSEVNVGCFTSLRAAFFSWLWPLPVEEPRCEAFPYATQSTGSTAPLNPPSLFPEWTADELDTLIRRWLNTHPGPLSHPQNSEIASLITLVDTKNANRHDIEILHATLLHRLRMDHNTEQLAREIGLISYPAVFEEGGMIEDFEPPPGRPLTIAARRLLLECQGEWKEALMPLPKTGVRTRYRRPKYWLVSVAAANGWTHQELDEAMQQWFRERGDDGLFTT
ncbi:hypothetical protein FPQ18DRAFT_391322 [Pyronema domesticum]|uniref:Uncharacterized protein n=1 Tax=Pyronema omphalodes (strain CBS 100304) TaxID=1076935 RepID=U4LKW0_PYROM|nr:hypothetical protein FPQ18DRAFT_391322 [Pyronema domesticum]CCX30000.1 Protein of unknown function [Pyronema omphalodes CBS 100304]